MQATPIKVFLAYMMLNDASQSVRRVVKRISIIQQIDDHTDVIRIELNLPPRPAGAGWFNHLGFQPRDFCVMRYWRLDDDGSYVVCLNSVSHKDCPPVEGCTRGMLHSVLSIAPRKDYTDFEEDFAQALVSLIVQVKMLAHACHLPTTIILW